MKVRTNVKAGGMSLNHNESLVRVRTNVKAGGLTLNHNESLVRVRTNVKAGAWNNHNETMVTTAGR